MTNKTFTTNKGVAYYPYISAPDTKFDDSGHYKVNLCLSKEDAKNVTDLVQGEILAGIKAMKDAKPSKQIKQAPLPYHDELDDDTGEPTGNVIIKFKSKAAYKPAVFDAKGSMMAKHNIYGGSVVKVNGSAAFYDSPSIGAGVTLRLRAVQVIEYVEGSSGAGKFGFGEEVGFTADESVAVDDETVVGNLSIEIEEKPAPAPVAEIQQPDPAPQPKARVVEEPAPAPVVSSEADDLAAEIARLVGDNADD
tara:strand:+ start:5663 stop:6412 length:750 start_codon:yes stop_codon:yes gene_type:complete